MGVTLSERQLEEARARVTAAGLDDQVSLELRDYRDVTGEFDKITSVGMAEHVGRANIPLYFEKAYDLLRPVGLMMHHAIADGIPQAKIHPLILSGEFARRKDESGRYGGCSRRTGRCTRRPLDRTF